MTSAMCLVFGFEVLALPKCSLLLGIIEVMGKRGFVVFPTVRVSVRIPHDSLAQG